MGKGRKATPTALKKLRGTDQPVRVNKNEINTGPITKLPPPPKGFTPMQRKIYRTKGTQLMQVRVLSLFDLEMFSSFCREYGNYIDTSRALDNYGPQNTIDMLLTLDLSYLDEPKKSDVLAAFMIGEDVILKRLMRQNKEAWERAKTIASEFGFTPSARVKLVVPQKDEDDDEFD